MGSVYANTRRAVVMRDQYHRDPQTISLHRIAFISCSELDFLKT